MNCEQCQALLPSYLSGDLTPAEAEAVRAHLAEGCPACAGALAEDAATVALLARSLDPVAPARGAKDRLMAQLRAGQSRAGIDGAGDGGGDGGDVIDGVEPRRAGRRRWRAAAAVALAACVAIAALAGWHVVQRRQHAHRVAALQGVIADREARLARLQSLVTTNQLSLIALGGQPPQPKASGRVFWDKDGGRWHVFVFDMQPPPPGREYCLWFITPDQRKVPAGTLAVDAGGEGELVAQVPPELGPIALAAVTDEPIGGSPQPTGKIQLVGKVE